MGVGGDWNLRDWVGGWVKGESSIRDEVERGIFWGSGRNLTDWNFNWEKLINLLLIIVPMYSNFIIALTAIDVEFYK